MPVVRVLSFHAQYHCRHAGACCTSNWPIPVEADRLGRIQAAVTSGRLRQASPASTGIETPPDAPFDTPALLGRHDHACAFYDRTASAGVGRCLIQRALDHDSLPLACRQFPRVSVQDPRGVSVTLSHYCPTAAGLLDADPGDAFQIVTNAPAFPEAGEYVGLDARAALPPLLRWDLLMDWDAWWECERLAIELFSAEVNVEVALGRLRVIVANLAHWKTADGPLLPHVRTTFANHAQAPGPDPRPLVDALVESIPEDLRPARPTRRMTTSPRATARFLAAHAFANWRVHLGDGLHDWLTSIETAGALLHEGYGVRQADLLLRHLVN